MRKGIFAMSVMAVLLGVLFAPWGIKAEAGEVAISIKIGPPPAYVFHAPPPVVVIPGTYVYLVPGIDVDIIFYNGFWFRPYGGHWFRANSYNGPWTYLAGPKVPRVLVELPPYYRRIPPAHRRIPYKDLNRNWKRWEHDRYWQRDREWREGWQGRHEKRGREERGRGPERYEEHRGRRD
jgi:hypothetical protein